MFEVTDEDLAFLKNVTPVFGNVRHDIPPPTLCVDCRQQRRAVQWNETHLYKRACDFTGKQILSCIHPTEPYKVYDQEIWYSDKWDPMEYGRDIDFSRPFFDQYQELCLAVPHMNLFTGYQYDENCDYTNYSGKNKNCYLVFDTDGCRDCYYSYSLNGCTNCLECFRVQQCELCYGCIDSLNCYNSAFLQECENCSDSMFLKNCTGCKNCLMSVNLRNKEFYVENKPVSKEEFMKIRAMLSDRTAIDGAAQHLKQLALTHPQKHMHGIQNENVSGDYITSSKNARLCFDCIDLWDCAYIYRSWMPVKDSVDCEAVGEVERLYECSVLGYNAVNLQFCSNCLDQISDMLYCTFCLHSAHLFGCNGLRRKKYCILNKQYAKEEYEALVPKIIEHMKQTGEWGEFFPIAQSPFAYNESTAQDHYPLTKEQALQRGYRWRDSDPKAYSPATVVLPNAISDVKDDIVQEVLACAHCKKNYRIIAQELAFYRQMRLPLPPLCFDCRLEEKRALRNPRKLWERACQKCSRVLQTTYAPDRPEIVYCEECYLKEVY